MIHVCNKIMFCLFSHRCCPIFIILILIWLKFKCEDSFKVRVWHFGKHAYSPSCRGLNEKINTSLVSLHWIWNNIQQASGFNFCHLSLCKWINIFPKSIPSIVQQTKQFSINKSLHCYYHRVTPSILVFLFALLELNF